MDEDKLNMDHLLESYNFDLPEAQIAQYPCQRRGMSRLLCLDKKSGAVRADAMFEDLPKYLPPGALLIANNARVLPARIKFARAGGGKAEFLLLSPLPTLLDSAALDAEGFHTADAEALLKPGAKFKVGQTVQICPGLECRVLQKGEYGRHMVSLRWREDLERVFQACGSLPLPPYIKREAEFADASRYQTVYASKTGAVAAPTAGLHFTQGLREVLRANNFAWEEITLYVGYGTFSPVRAGNILEHKMHREYVEISEKTAKSIRAARKDGRPVIAVGTTSLRALEGAARALGQVGAYSGWTDIFIYPGYEFRAVDGLITNFHLPKSSLLMLTAAMAGRKAILGAYAHAVRNGYRFFSYGDASLIC